MEFLGGSKLEDLDGKTVIVFVRADGPVLDGTTCVAFLEQGKLFVDCIPKFPRKYVTSIPDDATVSASPDSEAPAPFAIIIEPNSSAGRFIQSLVDARNSRN